MNKRQLDIIGNNLLRNQKWRCEVETAGVNGVHKWVSPDGRKAIFGKAELHCLLDTRNVTVLMQIAGAVCNWTLRSYKLEGGALRFGLEMVNSAGLVVRGDTCEYPNQAILRGMYYWMKLVQKVDLLFASE